MTLSNFNIKPEQYIQSYDYFDVADATGIQKFYAYELEDSTGTSYRIKTDKKYSTSKEKKYTIGSVTDTKLATLTIDGNPANRSFIVRGKATFQAGYVVLDNGSRNPTSYVVVTIYHYDGSTETSLGSTQSKTYAEMNGLPRAIINIDIPLTQKHFKIGENIRIKVDIWGQWTNGGGVNDASVYIGLDPYNRDGDTITPTTTDIISQMIIDIPFKLQI